MRPLLKNQESQILWQILWMGAPTICFLYVPLEVLVTVMWQIFQILTRGWRQTSGYWGHKLWEVFSTTRQDQWCIELRIHNWLHENLVMRPKMMTVSTPCWWRISCNFVAWNPSNPFFIRTGSPSKALAQSRGIGSPRVDAGFSWFSSEWSWSHQDIHGDS